ncbi:cell division cycle- protein [Dissophora ornata]|nr:cell division cycle- protein [Dissophora ornata]
MPTEPNRNRQNLKEEQKEEEEEEEEESIPPKFNDIKSVGNGRVSDVTELKLESSHLKINPEVRNMAGRSHPDPSPAPSFLSRLAAAASGEAEEYGHEHGSAALTPPPFMIRSRTFAGSTRNGHAGSTSSTLASPFLTSESLRRPPLRATSKTTHSSFKQLGRTHSLLKQTVLVAPLKSKPIPLSFQPLELAAASSLEPVTTDEEHENREEYVAGDDRIEPNYKQQDSSIIPALDSCTAAMDCLSPPSAKIPSSFTVAARGYRSSITSDTASLSLPPPTSIALSCSDSEADDDGTPQVTAHSPCASKTRMSGSTVAVLGSFVERPRLRRYQTMIANRREFMSTLEPSGTRRTLNFLSSMRQKPTVFASENYVPNPHREDCQILPCTAFASKPEDTTKRVTPQTVVDVLDGKYKEQYDVLYIVDCRFPYEFEGGHIKSAVNVNTTDELEKLLLQPAITDKRVLLIFHCEFSCERGPRMARHLRTQDRAANASHYPAVFYSEVYVMQGGYSGFFKENKSYCWPEAYVEMQDAKHSKDLEKHMRTFGREFSRTASKGFLGTESKSKITSGGSSPIVPLTSPLQSKLSSMSTTLSKTQSESTANATISSNTSTTSISTSITITSAITSATTTRTAAADFDTLTTIDSAAQSSKARITGFSTVVSSVKEAVLFGAAPAPLSLTSNRPMLALRPSSKQLVARPFIRPSVRARATSSVSEHVFKGIDRSMCEAIEGARADVHSDSNSSSISSTRTSTNPFFSGFRQTKPVFRGLSP